MATTKTCQDTICFCKKRINKISSVGNSLILDNIQDPGNVGTLIRSALAFNFNDIYIVGGADVYGEKVIRSSAGIILSANLHVCSFEEIKNNKAKIADMFLVADMDGENINKIHLENNEIQSDFGSKNNDEFTRQIDQSTSVKSLYSARRNNESSYLTLNDKTKNVVEHYGKCDKYDYITINTGDVLIVDFNISEEKRKELIDIGYNQTIKYFTPAFAGNSFKPTMEHLKVTPSILIILLVVYNVVSSIL